MSGVHAARVKNTRQGSEHPGQAVGEHFDSGNRNADQDGSIPVAADGIDVPAERSQGEHPNKHGCRSQKDGHWKRNGQQLALTENREARPQWPDRITFSDHKRHPAENCAGSECHDEGI
ncbi:MAG: hypothetical protein WBX20_12870 [Terrimicrobiaceae bacterium]